MKEQETICSSPQSIDKCTQILQRPTQRKLRAIPGGRNMPGKSYQNTEGSHINYKTTLPLYDSPTIDI